MKTTNKILTSLLAASLAFTSVSYVHADETEVKKEETVYAFLDENGNFKNATVSEWLHSDSGFNNVKDESILSDIKNLKGDETPTISGSNLTWNSDSTDIYYQGTTEKELPLTMQVTYYFDGQKVDINDVVGQSGKLEVHIKLINNQEKTEVINGKTRHISTLFPCVIITDLKTDVFENVDAEGAIVVNESKNQVVSFVTVSGASKLLNDSSITELNDIKDKLKDEFVIKANVTNLEMPSIYCAVSGMMDLDEDNITTSDLDDLRSGINDLQDAMNEVLDGSDSLKSGANTLNDGVNSLKDGIKTAQSGANTLNDNSSTLKSGSAQLNAGLKQLQSSLNISDDSITKLVAGSTSVKSNLETISSGMSSLTNSVTYDAYKAALKNANSNLDIDGVISGNNEAITALTALKDAASGEETKAKYQSVINALTASNAIMGDATSSYFSAVNTSIGTLNSGISQLNTGYTEIDDGIKKIGTLMADPNSDTMKELATLKGYVDQFVAGSDKLNAGINEYTAGVTKLKSGLDEIASGADKLSSGSEELLDGTKSLDEGLNKFNNEGVSKLSTKVNDALNTLDDVTDVVNEVLDQSVEYNNYAGAGSNMETSVKFIMKTDEVSAPEVEEVKEETTSEKTTFWQRLVNLFRKPGE